MQLGINNLRVGAIPVYERVVDTRVKIFYADNVDGTELDMGYRHVWNDSRFGQRVVVPLYGFPLDNLQDILRRALRQLFEIEGDPRGTLRVDFRHGYTMDPYPTIVPVGLSWWEQEEGHGNIEVFDVPGSVVEALRNEHNEHNEAATGLLVRDRDLAFLDMEWDRLLAADRAKNLLRSHLNPIQLAQFDKTGSFVVRSPFGHRYLIEKGNHSNVFRLNTGGRKIARYCVVAQGNLPDYDQMLAQKMLLETDPLAFHDKANVMTREFERVEE